MPIHQHDTELEVGSREAAIFFERKMFKFQTENLEDDFWKANVSIYETLKYLNLSARNDKNRQRQGDKYRQMLLLALFIVAKRVTSPNT